MLMTSRQTATAGLPGAVSPPLRPARQTVSRWRDLAVWLVAGLVALPLLTVLSRLFASTDGIWEHLQETVLPLYISNSLMLALGTGICSLIMGVGCAWLVATTAFPGRVWLRWLLLAPAALPAYVVAYAYTDLLQTAGPIQEALRGYTGWRVGEYWFPQIRSVGGAIMVMSAVFFPYVYIFTMVSFAAQAERSTNIARSLGRSPWNSFLTVAIPMARPAIIGGLALVGMETLADFGTVQHFGIPTFTTGIYRTWFAMGAPVAATKLAAILLLAIGLVMAIEYTCRGRGRLTNKERTGSGHPFIHPGPVGAWCATVACCLPVLVGFILPVAGLIYLVAKPDGMNGLPLLFPAIGDTLGLAAVAGLVTVAIALGLSLAVRHSAHRARKSTGLGIKLATLGYAVPGTVLAVGMLVPFGMFDRWFSHLMSSQFEISVGLVLTGTLLSLVYAYAVRFMAVAVKGIEPGVGRLPHTISDAARTLGAGAWRRLLSIYLPVLRPSLLTAIVFVTVEVVKELPATLVLRPFHVETLALLAYRYAADERLVSAALPSLIIVVIGIIPVWLLGRTMFRRSGA